MTSRARRIRRFFLLGGLAVALGGSVIGWVLSAPHPAFSEEEAAELDRLGDAVRGGVVFDAAGCASCHASPGQPDRHRLGGGLALASPFGTFHVPNISPDPEDGIGGWRTIDLANAVMSGVSPDRRHYYPALPYVDYAHMQVEDLRDLTAYLRTLPPVRNRTPPHELLFPLTIRRLVGFWKLLYFDRSPSAAEPSNSSPWSRGHYLVEALGHCAECHSSRNLLGAIEPSTRFAGGPDQEGVGFVPNITPFGIGNWSEDDIQRTLHDGLTPGGRAIGSTMADIVTDIAALPQSDQKAIAVYIKSLPSRPTPSP